MLTPFLISSYYVKIILHYYNKDQGLKQDRKPKKNQKRSYYEKDL